MDTQACIGSRLETSFRQESTTWPSHCAFRGVCSAQIASKESRWNEQRLLLARKQMLVLEMKYCHGKDSWGHPCCSSVLAENWAENKLGTQSKNQIPPQNWERSSWWLPETRQETSKKSKYSPSDCSSGFLLLQAPWSPAEYQEFYGKWPKVAQCPGCRGEALPWAMSMGNAECWIHNQELLEPRVPKSPLLKQPPWEGHVVKALH